MFAVTMTNTATILDTSACRGIYSFINRRTELMTIHIPGDIKGTWVSLYEENSHKTGLRANSNWSLSGMIVHRDRYYAKASNKKSRRPYLSIIMKINTQPNLAVDSENNVDENCRDKRSRERR